MVASCGIVLVAAIVPLLLAGTHGHYILYIGRSLLCNGIGTNASILNVMRIKKRQVLGGRRE